ncbi:MAG: polysaccharide deacetylase family protein [Pseudomonadota bacterium]
MQSNPHIPFELSTDRPRYHLPNGKKIMVHIAMNVEYWPFERPMPRGIIPAPHGATPAPPDIPNFSWVEYGLRCGMPRFIESLRVRGLPASALVNAQVADVYPSLMEAILTAGYELVGHGWFQQSLKQADDERAVIEKSLDRLQAASGTRPRSWLGPGLGETPDTLTILKQNGIEFVHDWVLDDLPVFIDAPGGRLVGLPYSFELNDVPIYVVQHGSSDEFLKRVKATLAIYEREAEQQARILTLALHPHIISVPHVAYHFEKALDLLQARDDTMFTTSSAMGDWFLEQASGEQAAERGIDGGG